MLQASASNMDTTDEVPIQNFIQIEHKMWKLEHPVHDR